MGSGRLGLNFSTPTTSVGVELGGATRHLKCLHYKEIQKTVAKPLIHMGQGCRKVAKLGARCRTWGRKRGGENSQV
jgi:hypothetical protein